jgi:hypothetical protein
MEDRAKWKPCSSYNRIRKGQVLEGNSRPPTDAEVSVVCAVLKTVVSTWWKKREEILAAPKGSYQYNQQMKASGEGWEESLADSEENQNDGEESHGDDDVTTNNEDRVTNIDGEYRWRISMARKLILAFH